MNYNSFIKEIIEKLPKFQIGMKFEVLNSFYPEENISRDIKNINESFTKPLALSAKDKVKIRKRDKNILNDFINFKTLSKEKGDILVIKEIKDNYALCENISRPKEIDDRYYNNNELRFVKIKIHDLIEGNVKKIDRVRR